MMAIMGLVVVQELAVSMAQVAAQDPAFRDRVMAEAALALGFKEIKAVMVTKVVTINRIIRGISSNLVIRVT